MALPKFDDAPSDQAYAFISDCQDKLYNMVILETHRVDYTSYLFTGLAKEWWVSVIAWRPVGSPIITWEQFTEICLERFIPLSLRESHRDEFDRLHQGFMSVAEYETKFHRLCRYALASIPIEYDRIRHFHKGLATYIQEAIATLVLHGGSFQSIIDYTSMIENIRPDGQGSRKKVGQRGQFNRHPSKDRGFQRQDY